MAETGKARRILVIDDEPVVCLSCRRVLEPAGHAVEAHESPEEGLAAALTGAHDLILLDLIMPRLDGLALLRRVRAEGIRTPVVVITGYAKVDTIVEAMRLGASDVLTKPFTPDELLTAVERTLAASPARPARTAESSAEGEAAGLIAESDAMRHVLDLIRRVAPAETSVLLVGETGTGKERVARAIHRLSPRAGQPFVACDCGALAPTLLESELFGHLRGSFTGAVASKRGLFDVAQGGTLFLDELGGLAPEMQAKLLRAVEHRTVRPVGDTAEHAVDVRLIGATNRDLGDLVGSGEFRADLRFRLSVFPIGLPPLRERREDIPLLVARFLDEFRAHNPVVARDFSGEAIAILQSCPWPGNVRELRNLVERLAILCDTEVIGVEHLPPVTRGEAGATDVPPLPSSWEEFKAVKHRVSQQAVETLERQFLREALCRAEGNVSRAARETGMQRTHFHSLIAKYGLSGSG